MNLTLARQHAEVQVTGATFFGLFELIALSWLVIQKDSVRSLATFYLFMIGRQSIGLNCRFPYIDSKAKEGNIFVVCALVVLQCLLGVINLIPSLMRKSRFCNSL